MILAERIGDVNSDVTVQQSYGTFIAFLRYYNMINQLNAEQFACIFQPFCDFSIRLARLNTSTRVIMRHDYRGGPIGYGFGKDFARMNQASSERADGNDALSDEAVGAVEREADKVFLLFVTDINELLDCFFGAVDDRSLGNFELPPP